MSSIAVGASTKENENTLVQEIPLDRIQPSAANATPRTDLRDQYHRPPISILPGESLMGCSRWSAARTLATRSDLPSGVNRCLISTSSLAVFCSLTFSAITGLF